VVCAALAVVLARGPIPWIHSHETMAHGHLGDALAWHIRHFHSPGDDVDHWHIHWTLPWQILICPCQYDSSSTQERASALEMPLHVAESASVNESQPDLPDGAPALLILRQRERPRWGPLCSCRLHFLDTYSPRVTARALYCVAQC